MKRLFAFSLMLMAEVTAQQPSTGTITGVLTGEDGTAIEGGTVVLHLVLKAVPRLRQPITVWTSTTRSGGTFQFTSLPEGNYTLCPSVVGTTWLSPCEWNFPTPTATITRSAPTVSVAITLKRGVAVPIRIDDPSQLLAQNEGKTPGAGLLLQLSNSSPGSFFRLVPLVSQDSTGRNYQIVIPFNTPLTLFVYPTLFHVSDAGGAPLSPGVTTKIALQVASGQQVPLIKFAITGIGN